MGFGAPGAGVTTARRPRLDLTGALTKRLRHSVAGELLAGREATVVFAPTRGEPATIELHHGRVLARRGLPAGHANPTATVHGNAEILAAIVSGDDSGSRAFLDGDVTVRGDLALTLALDGLFDPTAERPPRWPTAGLLRAAGVDTAYLDAGPRDGPPVLMLHGLGATNASLLPLLWDLAADHRVVAPDLPGHGASSAPKGPYSPGWFVPWVEAVSRELGLPRPVLVGNSLGGRISLEYAAQRPAATGGLVLLCPSPPFRRLRQWVPAVRLLRPGLAGVPLPLTHRMVVQGIRAMFAQPDRLPTAWYDAAADEYLRVTHDRAHRVAFFSCLRQIYLDEAFGERGFWSRLPALTAPALFIWGKRDRLVPSSFARHVATALPQATSVVLDDCGHVPQFERPEQTAALTRRFLTSLG